MNKVQAYELFIGLRYTRAKRRNHFVSFISFASGAGIALGVAALIVVLSVMNGFQKEVRDRMLSAVAHVQIGGYGNSLANWEAVAAIAKTNEQVVATAPYVNAQALLSYNDVSQGAVIRGILPDQENTVVDFSQHMVVGSEQNLQPGEFGIVLGTELAQALSAKLGDKLILVAPQGQFTPAGILPRMKQFTVVGIFKLDHYEFDAGLALIHMRDAQVLYRKGDSVSGVRLKLRDLQQAPQVARELAAQLPQDAYAGDWSEYNKNWFIALQIEKRMMFIILVLIVAVAAFNLVSTLVMVVTDKQSDIAILRTLGATPISIMKIFMVQGILIGFMGTVSGVVGGVLLAVNIDVVVPFIEQLLGVRFLAKGIYYISQLPSEVYWQDVTVIAIVSFVLSVVATLYPSWSASKVNPAEQLRYE
jgi:lipoprotein-releasing system permease protein